MGWFSRKKKSAAASAPVDVDPVAEFWQWWATAAEQVDTAIRSGQAGGVVELITQRVHAINPDLVWELAPGERSTHLLIVTAAGNPAALRAARTWLQAAPEPSPTWEYHDFRQPAADLSGSLQLGQAQVSLAQVQVATTRVGNGLQVQVHHPAFSQLPTDQRDSIGYLIVDTVLGEQRTHLWVDAIEVSQELPAAARPVAELPDVVAELANEVMPAGELSWSLMRDDSGQLPVLVMCLARLEPTYAPHCDTHITLTLPYQDADEFGMPGEETLTALRAAEDHLEAALGAAGIAVAQVTSAGQRTLHFYVDFSATGANPFKEVGHSWPDGGARVELVQDPGWSAVSAYRQ